jgi:hypothetical protein
MLRTLDAFGKLKLEKKNDEVKDEEVKKSEVGYFPEPIYTAGVMDFFAQLEKDMGKLAGRGSQVKWKPNEDSSYDSRIEVLNAVYETIKNMNNDDDLLKKHSKAWTGVSTMASRGNYKEKINKLKELVESEKSNQLEKVKVDFKAPENEKEADQLIREKKMESKIDEINRIHSKYNNLLSNFKLVTEELWLREPKTIGHNKESLKKKLNKRQGELIKVQLKELLGHYNKKYGEIPLEDKDKKQKQVKKYEAISEDISAILTKYDQNPNDLSSLKTGLQDLQKKIRSDHSRGLFQIFNKKSTLNDGIRNLLSTLKTIEKPENSRTPSKK